MSVENLTKTLFPSLATFLAIGLGTVILAVLKYTVTKNAPLDPKGRKVMTYSWPMRGLVIGVGIFSAVLCSLAIKQINQQPFGVSLTVLALGGTALYGLIEISFVRITYDQDYIHFSSPWGRNVHTRWQEITGIGYSATHKWYVITTTKREKIRVSVYLSGASGFLRELEMRQLSVDED